MANPSENPSENPIDLIEIFSTFANQWSMENQGCAGTLFLFPHDESQQGVEVSSDFNAQYDAPVEQTQAITHSSFSFQNTSNGFTNQQILINTTTPVSEQWKLTESVCPGGNDFFTITTPILPVIPGLPSANSVQLCDHITATHTHSYTWDVDQLISLPPRSSTTVSFQTHLINDTRNFQFQFWMTGSIGVTSMNPINGSTETYFPITQVLQWYQSDLITLDFELNKVTCLNKGVYSATYQAQPQLLIKTTSLDNPTIVQESVLDLTTGATTLGNNPNGCCN